MSDMMVKYVSDEENFNRHAAAIYGTEISSAEAAS